MFTGNEDQSISLGDAVELTKNYRTANPNAVLGTYFSAKTLNDILAQEGCVGVIVYYGQDKNGLPTPIVVGVDGAGDDLYTGLIGNKSYRRPPYSGASNPLNS